MRPTLRTACLLLATVSPSAVLADTTIGSSTSTNVRTSTVASGSADNISITSGGSVTPTSGTAVTIDSNNSIDNAGNVAINSADNSIGVAAPNISGGGLTSGLTNSGTIRVDDSYAASDTNGDGVNDGPFAQGTGRYGVQIAGSGNFTGNIVNSGSIIVEGNNSYGFSATAPIVGGFQNSGTISVLGDNGTAIRLGAISGTVAIAGTVTATGRNDVGVALTGNLAGALVIHGTITSTGYSATTAPTDLTKLTADNLLQGGSGIVIGGNVAGGVLVGASLTATTDTTVDADNDGIGDSTEGQGTIHTYGAAPALLAGSASNAITLSPVSGLTSGLVNNGDITAAGVYAGINATAVQIGGLGQAVTLVGGLTNGGTITATSTGGTSIGVLVGSGADIGTLTNSGTIYAYSGTAAGSNARSIVIATGATLSSIVNSGTINTIVAVTGGTATAILDQSGGLTSVANTGAITVAATDSNGVAIDVRSNSSGFTYTQSQAASTTTTTAGAPSLIGAILTGSGAATIAASAGTISSTVTTGSGNNMVALSGTAAFTGSVTFGAGNDSLTLADTSRYTGTVDFGGGSNSLAVGTGATFSGQIANAAATVAVTVASGGTLALTNAGATSLSSLSLAGTLAINADPAAGTAGQVTVAGATGIAPGALLKVSLSSVSLDPFTFTVLKSGTLTGSANLGLTLGSLPYLLSGTLSASDAAGTISLTIGQRAAADYGFRRGEAGAYPAVYAAIASNAALSSLFLSLADQGSTLTRYRQMLPDYEGGTFDMLSNGTRILAPGPNATPVGSHGDINIWMQQAWWNGTQSADLTPGYKGYGWGMVGGADVAIGGFGRVGLSLGYLYASVDNAVSNKISANDFQGGINWVAKWGGLRISANGTAGFVRFGSVRSISGTSTIAPDLLTSRGHWSGLMTSANAAASYELKLGMIFVRPSGTLDYARLHENKHSESEGGAGFDLTVDARNSSELSATGLVALGLQFGGKDDPEAAAFKVELEGGRREILSGTIGATTAHFAGGSDFTLTPEERNSGYIAQARLSVGSNVFNFSATGGTERRDQYHGLVGRFALRLSF